MASAHFLEFAALAVACIGLLAVLAEVLIKDPGLIVRGMLRRESAPRQVDRTSVTVSRAFDVVSANSNERRKAA